MTATVVVACVLALTSLGLLEWQREVLTADLDESLDTYAAELAATASGGSFGTPLPTRVDDDGIAQLTRGDKVLAATGNLADEAALPAPNTDKGVRTTHLLADDVEYRLASRRTGDLVVHVGAPIDDIHDSVATLRKGLAIAVPTTALILAALVWWIVGRTLEPVDAIRREVADISGRNITRRVRVPRTGDEVERLAGTMNAMLDRVQTAVERQQRFVADASHELRGPLTRIRADIEVDLQHPATADMTTTHLSVLEESIHLQQLIDDLLTLARLDAEPRHESHRELIDLDTMVLAEVDQFRQRSTLRFDTTEVAPTTVVGDVRQLRRVVHNLLDNASRFARSTVTLAVTEGGGHTTLRVGDDGPGIPIEHRDDVFARFTRLDDARSSSDGGTGLGLAIVRDIVEHHRGTVRVTASPASGAEFVVALPQAPVAPARQ